MAPFLANHSSAADSYKWMLYGDDDTVFYVDNVMRMLEGLDDTMPYFITDHIWFLRSLTEGVCVLEASPLLATGFVSGGVPEKVCLWWRMPPMQVAVRERKGDDTVPVLHVPSVALYKYTGPREAASSIQA